MSKMTMPMSNLNQGGYVPHGFMPNAPAAPGNGLHAGNYGFANRQQQQGYAPVPQIPYGDTSFAGAAFPPYAGPPAYGGVPAQQMPYGGSPAQQHTAVFQPGYALSEDPIVTQPIAPGQRTGPQSDWMSIPVGIPNCPRGLEYLTSIDQLLVKQKVELLEAITGFETNNKFTIKNALGQKVYYAVEENDCCTRNMCGPARPFDMKIFDNFRNEVILLHRPLACSSFLFPCCLQSMEVSAPPGNVIGSIEQEWTVLSPSFKIKNHIGDTVLRIQGPLCTYSLCGEVEFNIVSLTGECIGKISKQWSGLAREIFTDADFFGITFPLDLDVRMKVVLLGATFLIDAMFFEKAGNVERDGPGML